MRSEERKFLIVSVAAYLSTLEDFYFSPDILENMMSENKYKDVFRYHGDELVCSDSYLLGDFIAELQGREINREMEAMAIEGLCELRVTNTGDLKYEFYEKYGMKSQTVQDIAVLRLKKKN